MAFMASLFKFVDKPKSVSINSNDKRETKKMNYFNLHTVLFVAILLLTIVTICYYCIKRGSKRKRQTIILNIKTESNNKLKEISI